MKYIFKLLLLLFILPKVVFADNCKDIIFYGEFSTKQFNEKGILENKSFIAPLPSFWNDSSNYYSKVFVKFKKNPKSMVLKNDKIKATLKRLKNNKFSLDKDSFFKITRGKSEVIIRAIFNNFHCDHKLRIGGRD